LKDLVKQVNIRQPVRRSIEGSCFKEPLHPSVSQWQTQEGTSIPWNLRLIEDSRQAVPIFPEKINNIMNLAFVEFQSSLESDY